MPSALSRRVSRRLVSRCSAMFASGLPNERAVATDFLAFVDASPSPYHAVDAASNLLQRAGYERISETDPHQWTSLKPNTKYFFTRNQSTLFAVAIGGQYRPGNGVSIAAAHTDSPVLRVKPMSASSSAGVQQVNVETYGGGLWNTWFDRDLSVAGRVFVANEADDGFEARLVRIDRPLMRIPNLAIHLNRSIHTDGFKPNFETHMVPLLATEVKAALNGAASHQKDESSLEEDKPKHHPLLLQVLAEELAVPIDRIRDFELSLFDTQPACLGGALNEFVFAPRLDNLMMSFCSVRALLAADDSLDADTNIRMVCLFDHEEIGSSSAQGAASNMLLSVLQRLHQDSALVHSCIRRSLLVSADMAHACHPNYPEKHEARHRPAMHKGVVIKYNAKQRYATNSETALLLKEIARRHQVPLQEFVVRNDSGCGSTIGPILAANTGMRTIDIGVAQLAMHSIREMCGTQDVASAIQLLQHFFADFAALDQTVSVD